MDDTGFTRPVWSWLVLVHLARSAVRAAELDAGAVMATGGTALLDHPDVPLDADVLRLPSTGGARAQVWRL